MLTEFLNQAFWRLTKVVPKKTKTPVLSYVHFCSDGHTLAITATNLERWLTVQIPSDGSVFECIAPFQILKRLFRVCPDEVTLKAEGDRLWLVGESFQYSFRCLPLNQYPIGSGSELITLPVAAKTRRKPSQSISGTTPLPIQEAASTEQKSPSYVDAIVPFDRPIKTHPELGTLEPESSEALRQMIWQLSEVIPMPEYVISLDEMKDSVVISLRPDEAFELASGVNQAIVVAGDEQELKALEGKYCLLHAAAVEGEVLAESTTALRNLGVSVEDAPAGNILGYCQISDIQKYSTEKEWKAGNEKGYHVYTCTLKQFQEHLGAAGQSLYGVIVSSPIMLADYVPMLGEISEGFWSPEVPWETAALRKVFEKENVGVDVDRELRLPGSLKK